MNTPDREPPAIGRTADGTVVFCAPGDPDVELITAIRDEFDRADPTPPRIVANAYMLGDLRGLAEIPQYSAFVKELLRDDTPTGDDTAKEDRP